MKQVYQTHVQFELGTVFLLGPSPRCLLSPLCPCFAVALLVFVLSHLCSAIAPRKLHLPVLLFLKSFHEVAGQPARVGSHHKVKFALPSFSFAAYEYSIK